MKKIIYNHIIHLFIALIYFALLCLGILIPVKEGNAYLIMAFAIILGIFIIANLIFIYIKRNKYSVSEKLLNRFKNKIEVKGKSYFRILIFIGFFIYALIYLFLFIIGLLSTSFVKVNLGYYIVTAAISLILATFTFQELPLKKLIDHDKKELTKEETLTLLNLDEVKFSRIIINNESSLNVEYDDKITINLGIEILPFLNEEERQILYKYETSLLSDDFGKSIINDAKKVYYFKVFLKSYLLLHFLNVIFFFALSYVISASFNNLLLLSKDKLDKIKLGALKTDEDKVNYLNLIYKLTIIKYQKELNFEFTPYKTNLHCPREYYEDKVKYKLDFINNNLTRLNELVAKNYRFKGAKDVLEVKDYNFPVVNIHFNDYRLLAYFDFIYYFKNVNKYEDDRYINYVVYENYVSKKEHEKDYLTTMALASSYLYLGDYLKAKELYKESLKLKENAYALFHLGEMLIKEDDSKAKEMLIKAYTLNSNYLEKSLNLIDKYELRNNMCFEKGISNASSTNMIKSRLDTNEKEELTSNSEIKEDNLTMLNYERIINLAKRFNSLKEVKIVMQVLPNKNKHYVGLYFDPKGDKVNKVLCFKAFYFLLDNFDLEPKENYFFLYELKRDDKKYDVYSSYLNSELSKTIYKKEEK